MRKFNWLVVPTVLGLLATGLQAAETVVETTMKAETKLPFADSKQVSGLKVELKADGTFTAPDQVCALIFEKDGDKAVVRVWHNMQNKRYFVSLAGDDANPGTMDKPWKSLGKAMKTLVEKDRTADIYVAGGDYWLDDEPLIMRFQVSIFGGFDDKTWRRDPAITASVLLPQGFRENWIDDMSPRFKDLRRAEHRVTETRLWATYGPKTSRTLVAGPNEKAGKEGTPDTFLDGVTAYGCQTVEARPEASLVEIASPNQRTIRNCIFIQGYGLGHAFMPGGSGVGLYENNILWGGLMGARGHARPQMVFQQGATMRRNLHIGATGGDYNRMFLCWGEGGTVEDSQIHAGNSMGWMTFLQGFHGATNAKRPYVFTRNLVWTDHVARPWVAAGLVLKDNTFFVRGEGFGRLHCIHALTITGNTFNLMAKANKGNLFPTGDKITHKLGGTWERIDRKTVKTDNEAILFHEPTAADAVQAPIENNKINEIEDLGRRARDFVDAVRLRELVGEEGDAREAATIRPAPATALKAVLEGGAVKLSWTASPDEKVIGYRVYYGPVTNSYAHTLVVDKATSATLPGLQSGPWFFSVAAHKDAFVESWKLTNEVEVKLGS